MQKNLTELFLSNEIFNNFIDLHIENIDNFRKQFEDWKVNCADPILKKYKKDPVSWENTYYPLIKVLKTIDIINQIIEINKAVFYNPKRIKKIEDLEDAVATLQMDEIINNSRVVKKFKELLNTDITSKQKLIVNNWLKNSFDQEFKPSIRNQLNNISSDLVTLTEQFSLNMGKAKRTLKHAVFVPNNKAKQYLTGLPDLFLIKAQEEAKNVNRNGFLFYYDYNSIDKVLSKAENRKFRKLYYEKWQKINSQYTSYYNNEDILKKILRNKQKIANIHGFDSYSNLVLSNYVINNAEKADQFLTNMLNVLKPYHQTIVHLMAEHASIDGIKKLEPWDYRYYRNLIKNYNDEKIDDYFRNYFNFKIFFPKFLNFLSEQFNVSIKEVENENLKKIDKEIRVIEIKDKKSDRRAYVVVDVWSRVRKVSNVSMNLEVREFFQYEKDKNNVLINYVCLDYNEEAKVNGLSFYDLSYIFHEFGHVFANFFANREDTTLGAESLPWDLVELPSQLLEHAIFDINTIQKLSENYKTHQQIDTNTIRDTIEKEQYLKGYETYNEIAESRGKLFLHHIYTPYSRKSPNKIMQEALGVDNQITYNLLNDDNMSSSHHRYEYGPCEYIYLFSGNLAYQFFKEWQSRGGTNDNKFMRRIFSQVINSNKLNKKPANRLKKFVDLTKCNVLDFLNKNLEIELCGQSFIEHKAKM